MKCHKGFNIYIFQLLKRFEIPITISHWNVNERNFTLLYICIYIYRIHTYVQVDMSGYVYYVI